MKSSNSTHSHILRKHGERGNNSDYSEDGERSSDLVGFAMPIRRVDCGSFDDDNLFCVGWTREARSSASVVTFDSDETRLCIRLEHYVVEAKLFQIDTIYSNRSLKHPRVYFAFKHPPTFLRDCIPHGVADAAKWLNKDPFDFGRQYESFDRVPVFDHAHRRCAQYAAIYRVEVCDASHIDRFFEGTGGRLYCSGKIEEVGDSQVDGFDVENLTKALQSLSFPTAYQAEALMGPHKLIPKDVIAMMPNFRQVEQRTSVKAAALAVRDLRQLPVERGPFAKAKGKKTTRQQEMREKLWEYRVNSDPASLHAKRSHWLVYTVNLTPCFGVRAEGPHPDEGNRILRRYAGFEDHFLRARFADEDGSAIRLWPEGGFQNGEVMVTMRYGDALKTSGVVIAGRKHVFLAYGNSGLREGTCWFVRPFTINGQSVTAEDIRRDIGDLSEIRNPARYAARMGQAFSSSSVSLTLEAKNVHVVGDKATSDGKYEFTDGVGMVSKKVVGRINELLRARRPTNTQLTAFQIRLGGAKGMLALNPVLEGEQVVLRKSMVKFNTAPRDGKLTMEVTSYWVKPLPVFLNRQIITLLESLGVPKETFLELQRDAVEHLHKATLEPKHAVTLHNHNNLGRAANINALIYRLQALNINAIRNVPFLHDVNISFINFALRRIKYAARIVVPDCYTLVGVTDESGWLKPNEIVACIRYPGQEPRYLKGSSLVTRSPAIAPGDVQRANAVEPPAYHPLRALHNVVIFSQQGARPLFSMLSGGDLDGDLYNVLQNARLKVDFVTSPAEYERAKLIQIDRLCNIDDVADFLLDYIKLDKLGVVASRHLVLADQRAKGSLDEDCIKLAEMHSTAVDFAKTGILPDLRQLPRGLLPSWQRPDFMQREYYLEDMRSDFAYAERRSKSCPRLREQFYQSNKALGLMFRSIDVFAQTNEWAKASELYGEEERATDVVFEDDTAHSQQLSRNKWGQRLWQALNAHGRAQGWEVYMEVMKERVLLYYRALAVIAHDNCVEDKLEKLSEEEVFMGHILCRGPHGSRLSPFDTSKALQDDFEELCRSTRSLVLLREDLLGDDDASENDDDVVQCTTKHVVWRWLNFDLSNDLTLERLSEQLDELSLGDAPARQVAMHQWEEQLLHAVQNGAAWIKAAFEIDGNGRSAPWIMVPSVLKAQQCLDTIVHYREMIGRHAV